MVLDVRIGSVSCNEEAAWSSSDGSNKGFSSEWTCTETLLRDLELVVTGGNAVVADIMGAQTALRGITSSGHLCLSMFMLAQLIVISLSSNLTAIAKRLSKPAKVIWIQKSLFH